MPLHLILASCASACGRPTFNSSRCRRRSIWALSLLPSQFRELLRWCGRQSCCTTPSTSAVRTRNLVRRSALTLTPRCHHCDLASSGLWHEIPIHLAVLRWSLVITSALGLPNG